MADRILKINAFTTLDLLDGVAEGHGWEEEVFAVCNVTTDTRDDPEHVELQVELDNTDLDNLEAHADRIQLSAAEARELAGELESYAERVENAD
jgi:hypothetical protein